MNKQNHDIKNKFELFENLCIKDKIIREERIVLQQKNNNVRWLEGNSNCDINSIEIEDLVLTVEKQKLDKKYHIKLKSNDLSKVPFFRFDSDGPAHRNSDENIPLDKQKVTTPHFNSFNKEGFSIAFKNDVLKDEEKCKVIINDINFGISLFCQQSNSKLRDTNFPTVFEKEQVFDFDYHEMINFESLNFD